MRTIRSTLWLRTGSVSTQMANEANLCAEESWTVRTRNGGGTGWCGSAFPKFPAQLSCCVPSCFTDVRSTFDNFTSLVLYQIFKTIRSDIEKFHGDLQCVFEALFQTSIGALALRQFAVEQFFREAVIFYTDNMTGPTKLWLHQNGVDAGKRSKPKLKHWCPGCVFAIWCREFSSDRSCESGLASLHAVDK